jgi:hypothetical protein
VRKSKAPRMCSTSGGVVCPECPGHVLLRKPKQSALACFGASCTLLVDKNQFRPSYVKHLCLARVRHTIGGKLTINLECLGAEDEDPTTFRLRLTAVAIPFAADLNFEERERGRTSGMAGRISRA